MKVSGIVAGLVVAALAVAVRADVKLGDSYEQVVGLLGTPQGEIVSGDYRLMCFERGKLELRGGKVTKCELISEEQAERARQLRERQLAEARKAAEEARVRRIAEGTTIHKTKLADSAFMSSPASERVAYWQGFKRLYPEVPLGDEYTAALRELEQDYAARRIAVEQQQQIEDLEQRVVDAEQRARQAQRRSSYVYTDHAYGPSYGPSYVVGLPYWSRKAHPHAQGFACAPLPANNFVAIRPVQSSWVASPFLLNSGGYYSSSLYQGSALTVSVRAK